MIDLIDDGPQEDIYPETEDHAQLNPTEDRVTSLEGAFRTSTRVYDSEEMHLQDDLFAVQGLARKRVEFMMHLNGVISPPRWKVLGVPRSWSISNASHGVLHVDVSTGALGVSCFLHKRGNGIKRTSLNYNGC